MSENVSNRTFVSQLRDTTKVEALDAACTCVPLHMFEAPG